jgi:transcriptional regulator with XRE-family HTH domain
MSREEDRHTERQVAIAMIAELRALGLSYELIAVRMGELLGGINPSVTSIKRWKAGKNSPSNLNQVTLQRVLKQEKKKNE